MTEFKINDKEKIVGFTRSSPTGFKHLVEYRVNGNTIQSRSVNYYNRTWECYNYQTAIDLLLEKMVKLNQLTQQKATMIKNKLYKENC